MGEKRKTNAKRAPRGKPFTQGDPRAKLGGRPPITPTEREFRELCRQACPEALERIKERALGFDPAIAQRADEYLIDRGYGKPKQEQDVNVNSSGGLVIALPPVDPEG